MNVIKRTLSKPRRALSIVKRSVLHFYEWNLDAWRFFKFSTVIDHFFGNESSHVESDIIRLYHVIEKGLSMPEFRPRSGIESVKKLHALLNAWDGKIDSQISSAWQVLSSYQKKHLDLGIDITDILPSDLRVPDSCDSTAQGGIKTYTAPENEDREAFLRVMKSRASIRNFDLNNIPDTSVLERAVVTAMSSPSVCNRQTWKARCYQGQKAQELLELQNGNRGFGHTIPVVFVVTSDLRMFTGTSERYQAWIDGGMFGMSLLLGLHAEGLGAVSLNWSVLNNRDRKLRNAASIPNHERIIMLIGCGYPVKGSVVPVSTRRVINDVFVIHNS
jgi:nitroreductase